jgi:hypothetical protein
VIEGVVARLAVGGRHFDVAGWGGLDEIRVASPSELALVLISSSALVVERLKSLGDTLQVVESVASSGHPNYRSGASTLR